MIVGTEHFEIENLLGTVEDFLHVKRYFDGRHHIEQISALTKTPIADIRSIVEAFNDAGLLRSEPSVEFISAEKYLSRVNESCVMWRRQIGFHRLFGMLERQEVRREVFLGFILETYHYVASASKHIGCAATNCRNPQWQPLLSRYFVEEYDHSELFLEALSCMAVDRERAKSAHPIIGTMSLINMLCEIGRTSSLAYISCLSLIEARADDFAEAKLTMERLSDAFGFPQNSMQPIISHMEGDIAAGHAGMLEQALESLPQIPADEAHFAVNCLHDLKHSFDQFHDQILQYYSDISNYIPRLRVDYFSL